MTTKIHLTDEERDALRRLGGTGYVAILACRGPRGAKYRPVRSDIYRTEEQPRKAFESMRRRYCVGKQLFSWGGVFLTDATGDAVEV